MWIYLDDSHYGRSDNLAIVSMHCVLYNYLKNVAHAVITLLSSSPFISFGALSFLQVLRVLQRAFNS